MDLVRFKGKDCGWSGAMKLVSECVHVCMRRCKVSKEGFWSAGGFRVRALWHKSFLGRAIWDAPLSFLRARSSTHGGEAFFISVLSQIEGPTLEVPSRRVSFILSAPCLPVDYCVDTEPLMIPALLFLSVLEEPSFTAEDRFSHQRALPHAGKCLAPTMNVRVATTPWTVSGRYGGDTRTFTPTEQIGNVGLTHTILFII